MSQKADMLILLKQGDEPPLFCMHPVSGSSTLYRHLQQPINNTIYGISAQGVYLDTKPMDRIADMATCYIKIMRGIQPEGPLNVCGFSMGGLIAYEIACQLDLENDQPGFVGIIDSAIDDASTLNEDSINDPECWLAFIGITLGKVNDNFNDMTDPFWSATKKEKLDQLVELGKKPHQNTLSKELDFDFILAYYSFYEAMNIACIKFEPKTYSGDLHYFATSDGPYKQSIKSISKLIGGVINTVNIEGAHLNLFANRDYSKLLGKSISQYLRPSLVY